MRSSSKPQGAPVLSPLVCVVADDEVARRRVCSILRRGRLVVVAHAAAAEELEAVVGSRAIDAVVISSGASDALRDAVGNVLARWPEVRVVGILDSLDWR